MVDTITGINAAVLQRELEWLEKVIITRLNLFFSQETEFAAVSDIQPPEHPEKDAPYIDLLRHYQMNAPERIVLALAIAPHIKPGLLDHFFFKNSQYERGFTEFGGLKGAAHGGFLPTAETVLFLLAGNELNQRFAFMHLLDERHFFSAHNIITIAVAPNDEPAQSGALKLSKEFLNQFTTGRISNPVFSIGFPAKLITTDLELKDLVLPERTREQVDEIKAWADHSDMLMNVWGMKKKLKPGFKSLFYGPPGTGKTLTACIIGKQCGMDVYRIDLSMMISKYIGETEKNLSNIFSMAENKNWILFFDEAEALFGKRTGVSDAHDRFANQEVSYLLQRIEDFNGIVILATNLKSNIDDAFTRRFQSIIYFPVPPPEQRLQLWNNAFPEMAVRDEKINLRQIAVKYELTGGTIMNIIRYSSLMALKRNENVITLNDIEQGIKREYFKEGKVFP
jgi:ATPase family associated with various cellular activities (AAA)